MEHRFPNGLNWEKEGKLANPSRALARPGMSPRSPHHGRRVSNFSELAASTGGAPKRAESRRGGRERDSDLTSAKNGEQDGSPSPVERSGSRCSDDGFLGVLGVSGSGTGSGERAK